MSKDDRNLPAPLEEEMLAPAVASAPLAPAEPEPLAEALRYLQQRIPGFTHLSVQEKRSHARAANLDPRFIEAGIHAATAWDQTPLFVGRTGVELEEEKAEIERWDRTIVEMRALTDGMEAANTKRKHRLGQAVLRIYSILGYKLKQGLARDARMRPYYENMKRAYLRTRQFRRKKKQEEPAD